MVQEEKMQMAKHDERIDKRINGPTWDNIREKIIETQNILLNIDNSVAAELTTIYVKYKISDNPMAQVFGVIWLKAAKNVVLGLATPEKISHKDIIDAPVGMKYKGLTSYLEIKEDTNIPEELKSWAKIAFEHVNTLDG
jgi:hypothetical protein